MAVQPDAIQVKDGLGALHEVPTLVGVVNLLGTIGTRKYGTGQQVLITNTSEQSAAISATEVLVHASSRCFIKAAADPAATEGGGIPLEAGEKFHLRITSGWKIAVIRDIDDGLLNIVPVVAG